MFIYRVDEEQLQLGSLSHYINTRAAGYHELPPFPEEAPSSSERAVLEPAPVTDSNAQDSLSPTPQPHKAKKKKKSFYSDSDSSPPDGASLRLTYFSTSSLKLTLHQLCDLGSGHGTQNFTMRRFVHKNYREVVSVTAERTLQKFSS